MERFDCLCYGGATYDFLFLVDSVPASDQRVEALKAVQCGGGQAGTAAAALKSLGQRVGFIGAVGDDQTGRLILDDFIKRGVDVSELFVMPGKSSPLSAIQVEKATGKRTITVYYGGSLKLLDPERIDSSRLARTRSVHLDNSHLDLSLHVAKRCKAGLDAVVSLDGGNIPLDAATRILPYVDIYIPDDKTVRTMLGEVDFEEACRFFRGMGPKIVCITMGGKGLIASDGTDVFRLGCYPADVVDTTGAGDNFHGAFLHGILKGWPFLKTLQFASAFASVTCTALGGRDRIPSEAEVSALMDAHQPPVRRMSP